MQQLHFRLNFRNTQSVVAFAYSMDPFWPLSVLAEKKAKLQLDVLKLCGNFGAGDRDRTRDVQLGNATQIDWPISYRSRATRADSSEAVKSAGFMFVAAWGRNGKAIARAGSLLERGSRVFSLNQRLRNPNWLLDTMWYTIYKRLR